MSPKLLALALIGLVGGGLAAALLMLPSSGSRAPVAVSTSGKALVGGPFELVDQRGKLVTDQDYRGKHMLVFFGFTNCPDICPAGLQVMSQALEQLGPAAEKITPIFITLDPDRDTSAVLAQYVSSFDPRIVGLTGNTEQVAAVAKAYRVYSKKIDGAAGNYSLDHTSIMYLMGQDGSFKRPFSHGTTAEALASGLKQEL